jgi:hypothetical protein
MSSPISRVGGASREIGGENVLPLFAFRAALSRGGAGGHAAPHSHQGGTAMFVLVNWEGRNYSLSDWTIDQDILKALMGAASVEMIPYDTGVIFGSGKHGVTHILRKGELKELAPDEAKEIDEDTFGEWKSFSSINEALSYVNELDKEASQ